MAWPKLSGASVGSWFDSTKGSARGVGGGRSPFGEAGANGSAFRNPVLVAGRSVSVPESESTLLCRIEMRLEVLGGGGIGGTKPPSVGDLGGRGGAKRILSCDWLRFANRIGGGCGGGGSDGSSLFRDRATLALSPADGSSWWKKLSEENPGSSGATL